MRCRRLNTKPTIIAIDSLERLGKAKSSTRSHKMLEQLSDLYAMEDVASQSPTGGEREVEIDWGYSLPEFDSATQCAANRPPHASTARCCAPLLTALTRAFAPAPHRTLIHPCGTVASASVRLSCHRRYADVPDARLPFDVLPDHQRKAHNNTCEPLRKWRYFYVDGIFASATHYIIKSNDQDQLLMDTLAPSGYLYAHGDTRTFKRLRDKIQLGEPIVLLHNSGGPTTAFAWLQRVMAYQRPPPTVDQLNGPLKFLLACVSRANWTLGFGAPEVIMMRSLAERAPQLFRKSIVSVDVLVESEEQVLDTITSCFATTGGVPALGLGNAEVNVVASAWRAHMTLSANARHFWRYSVASQALVWTFALITTATVTTQASLGTGYDPEGAVLQRELELSSGDTLNITSNLNHIALVLPVLAALLSTMMSKFVWRDKWSVSIMCATQLVSEIYKYRMQTLHYDILPPPTAEGEPPPKPYTPAERARLARMKFVERISTLYSSCLTELSQHGALKKGRKKVVKSQRLATFSSTDNKPTLAEWFEIKKHVEKHFYKAHWTLPSEENGCSFLQWMSGLKPYVEQRTLREEMTDIIKGLAKEGKVKTSRTPLSEHESRLIRHALASTLGLEPRSLDRQRKELRVLQRSVVLKIQKDERNAADTGGGSGEDGVRDVEEGVGTGAPAAGHSSAKVMPVSAMAAKGAGGSPDDPYTEDPVESMRRLLMEEQGQLYGRMMPSEKEDETRKGKKVRILSKAADDDYLCGQLSIESYVMFRTRPLQQRLERQAEKLSWRMQLLDVIGFILNSAGAIFAAYNYTEWIALTVMVVSVISSLIEFTALRDQVVSCNLALRDIERMLVKWDSLSLVRRRTPFVKQEIVDVTESAYIMVVDAHTTAAANTQLSEMRELDEPTAAGEE